jgi:hypothetical protein
VIGEINSPQQETAENMRVEIKPEHSQRIEKY